MNDFYKGRDPAMISTCHHCDKNKGRGPDGWRDCLIEHGFYADPNDPHCVEATQRHQKAKIDFIREELFKAMLADINGRYQN